MKQEYYYHVEESCPRYIKISGNKTVVINEYLPKKYIIGTSDTFTVAVLWRDAVSRNRGIRISQKFWYKILRNAIITAR